jgi:hypothetical protein
MGWGKGWGWCERNCVHTEDVHARSGGGAVAVRRDSLYYLTSSRFC